MIHVQFKELGAKQIRETCNPDTTYQGYKSNLQGANHLIVISECSLGVKLSLQYTNPFSAKSEA